MSAATARTRILPAPGGRCFVRGAFLGLLAPAAGVLLSAGTFAQDGGDTSGMVAEGGHALRGVVTLDREPLSNIVVDLTLACDPLQAEGREMCGHSRRAFTDEGEYSFEGLAAGVYDVLIGCPDLDGRIQVNVGSGDREVQENTSIFDCGVHPPVPPRKFRGTTRWAR